MSVLKQLLFYLKFCSSSKNFHLTVVDFTYALQTTGESVVHSLMQHAAGDKVRVTCIVTWGNGLFDCVEHAGGTM